MEKFKYVCNYIRRQNNSFFGFRKKVQNNFIKFDEDIKPTSSSFSINEDILAVGFNTGIIRFYSTSDYHIEKEINERVSPITVIKYSKVLDLLACATKNEKGNNIIDIYYTNSLNKYCTLTGAQNKINGLDWSEDGKYIVSFSHEKECRIFSVLDKYMISRYSDVDYKVWNTWTIGYGWPLVGYYNSKEGKNPIYTCERFKINKDSNYIIAIGDANGSIKLYKYPIANENQGYIDAFYQHGKKVTNVKFGKIGSKNILLTSSSDGCLIAWKIEEI